MVAPTAETAANNALIFQKYVAHSKRRATDKCWIALFVAVFITWIASWQNLANHENDYKIDCNNTTTISISPELVDNITAQKIDADNSTNKTSAFVSSYWGKCWIFDSITFNVGFLDANYNRRGPIVVCANIVLCVILIVYGLASMRSDHIYCKQLRYFFRPLWGFLFYYRFLMYLPNDWEMMTLIPFDMKIIYWIIPELIVMMIWVTKKSPEIDYQGKSPYDDAKICFHVFMGYVGVVGVILFISLEILILKTTAHIYTLGWDNSLFYLIAGGSLYVGLTYFYFGLMVIACATGISFESQEISLKALLRAILIIARYHFGTACYHATLIFPRLHATFVLNESEFRKMPESKATHRFYLTHCKIHNVSPISTAVRGNNYSESIRELLRLFHTDSPRVNQFQGFSAICKSFLALIIGTNNLMLTLLWIHGAIADPSFMMGTWFMYLAVMFFNYIYMRAHDAAADTIWLHVNKQEEVKFET